MWYYISHRGRYLSWPSLHTFTCVSESLFGTHLTCSSSPSRRVCWSSCCCGAPRAETTQFSKHSQLCVVGTRHAVTVIPHCGTGFGKAGIKHLFPNVRRAGSSTFRTSRCVSASCAAASTKASRAHIIGESSCGGARRVAHRIRSMLRCWLT